MVVSNSIDNRRFKSYLIQQLENPENWTPVKRQRYKVWIGLPSLGTLVTDMISGKMCHTTPDKPYIVKGVCGEAYTIQEEELISEYVYQNNKPLTVDSLYKREINGKIDWFQADRLSDKEDRLAFVVSPIIYGDKAVNISLGVSEQNRVLNRYGVQHGLGDAIVCECIDGIPKLETLEIVNGQLLIEVYDTQMFRGKLGIGFRSAKQAIGSSYTSKPREKIILQEDIYVNTQENTFKKFDSKLLTLAQKLNTKCFHVQYETDGYKSIAMVVQQANGYQLGFRIMFDGQFKDQADIHFFEQKPLKQMVKTHTNGAANADKFIAFLEKKLLGLLELR